MQRAALPLRLTAGQFLDLGFFRSARIIASGFSALRFLRAVRLDFLRSSLVNFDVFAMIEMSSSDDEVGSYSALYDNLCCSFSGLAGAVM
jgi:hypothetical protein